MDWLSFFIGALVGWLVGWLIDYLICRPRRVAAEADLRLRLRNSQQELTARTSQLSSKPDAPAGLVGAGALGVAAVAASDKEQDLSSELAAAKAEAELLRGQLAAGAVGLAAGSVAAPANDADVTADLAKAQAQVETLQGQLAESSDLRLRLSDSEAETERARLQIERLTADLAAARQSSSDPMPSAGLLDFAGATAAEGAADATIPVPLVAPIVQPTEAESPKPDNLEIIEGIGPKIAELMIQNGISTFAQLADADVSRLRSILALGGPRFGAAVPDTWPQQALLARDEKWDDLKGLQDGLRAGRRD